MSVRSQRREAAIDRMADHVLSVGIGSATLRPLAAAAGTSDRMLLYYFADKDDLLTAVLQRIADRLLSLLDEAIPVEPPRRFAVLLEEVWSFMCSDRYKPYMHIWLDLASSAARELQPHRNVAGLIADGYFAWVARRLEILQDGSPSSTAALLLASIEGMYLLKAIGRPEIADSAMRQILA